MKSKTRFHSALFVILLALAVGMSARGDVDARFTDVSVSGTPSAVSVEFRFDRLEGVSKVEGWADGAKVAEGKFVPWISLPDKTTAYAFVIDVSNPARRAVIRKGADAVAGMVRNLDNMANVAIFSLGSTIEVKAPFGSSREEIMEALAKIAPEGDQSRATLIYSGCEQVIDDHLKAVPADRKALVVVTDGKDETAKGKPDEALVQKARADELVEKANANRVVVHAIGYNANLQELDNINNVAVRTGGQKVAAATGSMELPAGFVQDFPRYLASGGQAQFEGDSFAGKNGFYAKVVTEGGLEYTIPKDPVDGLVAAPPSHPAPAGPKAPAKGKADEKGDDKGEPRGEVVDPVAEPDEPKKPNILTMALLGLLVLLALLILVFVAKSRARAKKEAERRRQEELAKIDEDLSGHPVLGDEEEDEIVASPPSDPIAWVQMFDAEQTKVPITSPSIRIGRSKEDEIHIPNDSVSRSHCALKRNPENEWLVVDLDSGNGVVLNGSQIDQSVLKDGDIIELGEVKMRFLLS